MSRYLVTGGCGFIGSHLCEALVQAGHDVLVLDDLSTGHRRNLADGAELVTGSICDEDLLAELVPGIDGCFHLAAIASVERSVVDWAGTHRVNLGGTVALLDRIARSRPVPFVYASSAAVYGTCQALPLAETEPAAPLSAYGADKYGCELHAAIAAHTHGIPTAGLRFFNVYGPRQDPRSPYSGVISIFAERLIRGQALRVFGSGTQSRDFVFVADVVRALRAAMRAADGGARVVNVCTGVGTSVLQLADTLAIACALPLRIEHAPARLGEVRHSVGDPGALAAVLGVTAATPLAAGLRATMAWMHNEMEVALPEHGER